MRPAKIVAIVVGALLVLIGLGLLAPGGFTVLNSTPRSTCIGR